LTHPARTLLEVAVEFRILTPDVLETLLQELDPATRSPRQVLDALKQRGLVPHTLEPELMHQFERRLAGDVALDSTLVMDTGGDSQMLHTPHFPKEWTSVPRRIGPFELIQGIQCGGMGAVFRARHEILEREVALKLMHIGQGDLQAAERFLQEARATTRLRHPNIVTVHDFDRSDDLLYMSMDLVDGGTLADLVDEGPPPRRTAELMLRVARAVQHAHGEGLIHRDLKPENVLLDKEGNPRVADFGLARNLKDSLRLTRSGLILGTPYYMSPEQARGQRDQVDERSDIYGLGAVMYELLVQRPPVQGESVYDVIRSICDDPCIPPNTIDPSLPQALSKICLKCLAKKPAARYQSAAELADALEEFLDDETQTTASGRGRWWVAALALALCLTGGAVWRSQSPRPASPPSGDPPKKSPVLPGTQQATAPRSPTERMMEIIRHARSYTEGHQALQALLAREGKTPEREAELGRFQLEWLEHAAAEKIFRRLKQQPRARLYAMLLTISDLSGAPPEPMAEMPGQQWISALCRALQSYRALLLMRKSGAPSPDRVRQTRALLKRASRLALGRETLPDIALGIFEASVGNMQTAQALFARRAQDHQSPIWHWLSAQLALDGKQLALARQRMEIAYSRRQTDTVAAEIARSFLQRQYWHTSLQWCRRISKPGAEVQLMIATCHDKLGRPADALRALTRALAQQPNFQRALRQRAYWYITQRQYAKAIGDLDHLLRLRPTDPTLLMKRGNCQMELGKLDLARLDAERAIKLAPDKPGPWMLHAQICQKARRYPEGLRSARKGYALSKKGTQSVILLFTDLLVRTGKHSEAREMLRGELARRANPRLRIALSQVHYRSNQYTAAWTELELAEKRGAKLGPAFRRYKSTLLGKLGRYDDAIEHVRQTLRLFDRPELRHDLAVYQLLSGKLAAATPYLKKQLARDPTGEAAYLLGCGQLLERRWKAAEATLLPHRPTVANLGAHRILLFLLDHHLGRSARSTRWLRGDWQNFEPVRKALLAEGGQPGAAKARLPTPFSQGLYLLSHAELWTSRGQPDRARPLYTRALGQLDGNRTTVYYALARRRLAQSKR